MFNLSPGDEVICTQVRNVCECSTQDLDWDCFCGYCLKPPDVGKHYIVASTQDGLCPFCKQVVPILNAVGYEHPFQGWPFAWFRKPIVDEDPAEVSVTKKKSLPKELLPV